MSFIQKLKEFIDGIPEHLQEIAHKAGTVTSEIESALKSNNAVIAATIVDTVFGTTLAETVRETAIGLIDSFTPVLTVAQQANNSAAMGGLLQRLAAEITMEVHGKKKSLSEYIIDFEKVFSATK